MVRQMVRRWNCCLFVGFDDGIVASSLDRWIRFVSGFSTALLRRCRGVVVVLLSLIDSSWVGFLTAAVGGVVEALSWCQEANEQRSHGTKVCN